MPATASAMMKDGPPMLPRLREPIVGATNKKWRRIRTAGGMVSASPVFRARSKKLLPDSVSVRSGAIVFRQARSRFVGSTRHVWNCAAPILQHATWDVHWHSCSTRRRRRSLDHRPGNYRRRQNADVSF